MPDRVGSVGIIGLGMMGGGIARSLLDAGFDCVTHDVRASMRDGPRFAATWRDSAAGVARDSDVILVVVLDGEQTEDVLFGPGGVADAARDGLVVGLCSVSPSGSHRNSCAPSLRTPISSITSSGSR